jgi:outer membrane receptor protein involved in Fe transport
LRLGGTIDHDINATTSISSMLFVSPKYLQRSERGTYRDFTRYHVGGNLIGRTSMSLSPTVRSTLTVGADEAYQDGAILFYSLTPQGTRGTTLIDNKGEGANNIGFFAQDELVFGDRLTVTLGARYDRVGYYYRSFLPAPPVRFDSRSFSRVTPKVGASWLFGASHSLYGNIGGGIEVPAGNETDPTPNAAPALLNPLLDPIRSTTYEVGFKSLGPSTADAPVAVTYDVALYDSEVSNEIIPYNGGRFYLTAGKARRSGAELGVGAWTRFGLFGNLAVTASRNRYLDYVVDSVYLGAPGAHADFSGKKIVGVPDIFANAEIGMAVPGYSAFRVKAGLEHVGSYFADDANAVNVRAYSVLNLTAELREPITAANGWGVRGFVTLHNASNAKYMGSAFLNPDRVGGVPFAYEPGMPRSVTMSLSLGRLR